MRGREGGEHAPQTNRKKPSWPNGGGRWCEGMVMGGLGERLAFTPEGKLWDIRQVAKQQQRRVWALKHKCVCRNCESGWRRVGRVWAVGVWHLWLMYGELRACANTGLLEVQTAHIWEIWLTHPAWNTRNYLQCKILKYKVKKVCAPIFIIKSKHTETTEIPLLHNLTHIYLLLNCSNKMWPMPKLSHIFYVL